MPSELIDALIAQGARDLTVVNNNAGNARYRPGRAAEGETRAQNHLLVSAPDRFMGLRRALSRGEIELELVPQGNLAERIRAAGAGIGAFFTPTGLRHAARRGQGNARDQRPQLRARISDPRRLRADQGGPRRSLGQSRLSQDGSQLRADHGERGEVHDRAGARDRRPRRPRPGGDRHARDFRSARREGSAAPGGAARWHASRRRGSTACCRLR